MTRLSINTRLLLAFVLVAVLPLAGLAWFYLSSFERALTETVLQNVSSIADKKADQINAFIDERFADAQTYSRRTLVREAVADLGRAFRQGGLPATEAPARRYVRDLKALLESAPYYDLLLIDAAGNVVFSLEREADLGTNLQTGPYRNSVLALGWRTAMRNLHTDLTPFKAYVPSDNKFAAFLVTPVVDGGRLIGALALQVNIDVFGHVVGDRTGLGRTGETVLAERSGDEALFTAPLQRAAHGPYGLRSSLQEVAIPMRNALEGQYGKGIEIDYSGTEVAAAWRHMPSLRWGMVVKVDTAEAFAPARAARRFTLAALAAFLLLSGLAAVLFGRWFARAEESVRLYASSFSHSGEAILITDGANRIVAVNPAFTRYTGYTLDDIRGQNPRILSSGNTPPETYQAMWTTLTQTGYWQGELWDRRKDGASYPKWISISLVRDKSGKVTHHIASFIDISERKESEKRIHQLAHYDALTGLYNRFSLQSRLEQALLAARREHEQLAVMFIDMDRFKVINDTLGHPVGDRLLIEVAQRLRASVRESDIVARLGGDEFVVVLTGMGASMVAAPIAGKIVHSLCQPYLIEGSTLHTSPSVGISIFPVDGEDADQLMKNADTAMYHAKEQGRNNYQFFTAAMTAAAGERLELERGLREALAQGLLELHYQPQVCTRDGRICGVEALARWRHPQQGLIPPLKFIPIAEETGLIEPLGSWVLEAACQQLAAWRAEGVSGVRMAVNLSAHQLRSPTLVEQVRGAMARHGLQKGDLELEVTESAAMADPEHAIGQLLALRELGVELAIDDFGTGYSSLAYLKLLPIQTLKLDRTFVRDIESDDNDAAISAATLALAHSMGLKVVAEGVETDAQRAFLAAHDCDILQGYLFGKPQPAAELLARLPRAPVE